MSRIAPYLFVVVLVSAPAGATPGANPPTPREAPFRCAGGSFAIGARRAASFSTA